VPERLSEAALLTAREQFHRQGVCLLPLQADEAWLSEAARKVTAAFAEATSVAENAGYSLDVGMDHGWNEIVQRAKGRYDMLWGVDGDPHFQQVTKAWEPFVESILGGNASAYRLQFNGVLMTLPGASEQLWHIDGEHLFHEASEVGTLPPHCLNIFLPLVPLNEENGGTEFCCGSTPLTSRGGDEIVWQREAWKDEIGFTGDVLKVNTPKGGVLAFDYRVLHRALEHKGTQLRPVLYWTYTRRWFSDAMNFPPRRLRDLNSSASLAALVRQHFPALVQGDAQGVVFCDGAAGTQVPQPVIDGMVSQMQYRNANLGGSYATSVAAEEQVLQARVAAAALLGCEPQHTVFGLNFTNLVFHLARSVARSLKKGDNLVLSRACHDANISPWVIIAQETGAEIRWLDVRQDGSTSLDPAKIKVIDENTKVVAVGLASNAVGTIHSEALPQIMAASRQVGALSVLDGTHFVPHRRTNLEELGADILICSGYKFCGPHMGVMATRAGVLEQLRPYKVGMRIDGVDATNPLKDCLDYGAEPCAENCQISPWEMGTLCYEALAGFQAAVQYLASLGAIGGLSASSGAQTIPEEELAAALDRGFARIEAYERRISRSFLDEAASFGPHLELVGEKDPGRRTPTFALKQAPELSASLVLHLNNKGIYCTHGNHYAPELVEATLGTSGLTRISFMHYNTEADVKRVVSGIRSFLAAL